MSTLIYPLSLFRQLLQRVTREKIRTVFITVGINPDAFNTEWLVNSDAILSLQDSLISLESVFRITFISESFPHPDEFLPPGIAGDLVIGEGQWRGHFSGIVRINENIRPLHRLFLVGSGMHRLRVGNFPHNNYSYTRHHNSIPSLRTRWSRTIGALGGESIWERLIGLRIAVVGCGRTGSLVAVTLARSGIRRLTFIDPDVVEEHNLGEMDIITDADIGHQKVDIIAKKIQSLVSTTAQQVNAISASVTAKPAITACRRAQVIFCCVDSDAARLVIATLATLFHKVLIDIGTGIFFHENALDLEDRKNGSLPDPSSFNPPSTHRRMGADIRLILPADGCLLCRGNLTNYARAVEEICQSRPIDQDQGWNQQRAGSLRTLNQLAAALGVQMLQDLVAERLQTSTWTHVEFDNIGRLTVNNPSFHPHVSSSCPLCQRSGLGDAGLR